MKPCEMCGKPQDDRWPGEKGELCQECWEKSCDDAWWEAVIAMGEAGLLDEQEAE